MQKTIKALNDAGRVKSLRFLLRQKKPTCACKLKQVFGKDLSVVFRHVRMLEDAGLIETFKDGRMVMCSVKNRPKVLRLMRILEGF